MKSNIYLDFLNRDSRQIFGLFENSCSNAQHITLLTNAINVAVFLCEEYCIVPPGFIAECPLVKEAIRRRQDFRKDRLLRMPMRESSIDQLFDKKTVSYNPQKDVYQGLFDESNRKFLKKFPQCFINRESKVGAAIITDWEAGPDINKIWQPIINKITAAQLNEIRDIPKRLLHGEIAVTWPAISKSLPKNLYIDPNLLRRVLQNNYFQIYLDEFNLKIITNIPFSRDDFGLGSSNRFYDWEFIRAALKSIKAWNLILELNALSLCFLRLRPGYLLFKDVFAEISNNHHNSSDVARLYSTAHQQIGLNLKREFNFLLENNSNILINGISLVDERIDQLDYYFAQISNELKNNIGTDVAEINGFRTKPYNLNRGSNMSTPEKFIAIFVALKMEKDILVKRWGLEKKFPGPAVGKIGDFPVKVFSSEDMGRVPAAIATMQFLFENKDNLPKLIIVAGIAGGFAKNGVEKGNIIIASKIVDMATRKVKDSTSSGVDTDFRVHEYDLYGKFYNFVESDEFDSIAWSNEAIESAEWPEGRRPAIKRGPLASLDEVVSSERWATELLDKDTQLLGVEMESGGVCAAAKNSNVDTVVIRGISDHADPSKRDDNWRKISMKTVAILLEKINYNELLSI